MAEANHLIKLLERARKSITGKGAWPLEKKALAASLVMMATLCAYRFYALWTTGFIVSDEYGYVYIAMHPTPGIALTGDRVFFSSVNIALFQTLGINNFTSFALFLPFYLFVWGSLTIVAFYKTMKSLGYRGDVVAIALLSSFFVATFDLLSLGFLTEPVGLAMAALGTYFVVKFVKARKGWPTLLIYPILASLSFTAAAYSREPYSIFILAGFLPVLFAAANHWRLFSGKRIQLGTPNRKVLAIVLVLGVVSFQGTSAYVQLQSGVSLMAQVNGAASGLAQTLSHPLAEIATSQVSAPVKAVSSVGPTRTSPSPAIACPAYWTVASPLNATSASTTQTTSTTVTSTTTSTTIAVTSSGASSATTSTETTSSNSVTTATASSTLARATTSVTANANVTSSTSVSSTSTGSTTTMTGSTVVASTLTKTGVKPPTATTTSNQTRVQVVLSPRITDTAMIFLVGLFLGWGPVITLITLLGCLALLVAAIRKRNLELVTMLTLALLALGSFLGVAFVFSSQPSYLTFQHFSTLIRFSDTAIPAYFIAAPVAFELILKKRKYVVLVAVGLLLTLTAVPAYQAYASSNLNLSQNPFSFGYRTPGVVVRDYATGIQNDSSFVIMGLDNQSWWWTPGSAWIDNLTVSPYLTYQELVSHGWSTFYVLGTGNSEGMYCELHAVVPHGATLGQYSVVSEQTVANQDGYELVKIQLQWQN